MFQKLKIRLKKTFRKFYYFIYENKVVEIKYPPTLIGSKWIIRETNGRAYFKGYYEKQLSDYLCENLNKDSIFFDIGAHVGYFSLLACRICVDGVVLSFEPFQQNIDFIRDLITINKASNWRLVAKAVSSKNGNISFKEGNTSSTGKIIEDADGISVGALRLDRIIQDENIYPDIIKIDVEGHGDHVFRGFDVLKQYPKPLTIILEVHRNSPEPEYLANDLELLNLKFFDLKGKVVNIKEDDIPPHIIIKYFPHN